MKCVYCIAEMNEGAIVCHSCGRTQPAVIRSRWLWGAFVVALMATFIYIVYSVEEASARKAAIEQIASCKKFQGQSDSVSVEMEIDQLQSDGMSWRTAANTYASISGCPANW